MHFKHFVELEVKYFLQVHIPRRPEGNMEKVWNIARKVTSALEKKK